MTPDRREWNLDPFRVLATCEVFEPGFRGGGPVRSVANIVDTVSQCVDLSLVTRDRDLDSAQAYPGLSGKWIERGRSRVFYLDKHSIGQWLRLGRRLHAEKFDLLYVNSLWEPTFSLLAILAVKLHILHAKAVLLAPRGELSPGALDLKGTKKRLFLKLWAPLLASLRVVWHASTPREAADIAAVCPWARVEVAMNQVTLPPEPTEVLAEHDGPLQIVFLSRVSPKKNLALVLAALRCVSGQVRFDIYGPLEDKEYWSDCEAHIDRMPGNVVVTYRGEVLPAAVRHTFAQYDTFVFPTLGENFGHVIAESLSASCPVICSNETPWTAVLETGGGVVVRQLDAGVLGRELERLAGLTPAQRLQKRQAAAGAYRSWRQGLRGENVLDRVRVASEGGSDAGG